MRKMFVFGDTFWMASSTFVLARPDAGSQPSLIANSNLSSNPRKNTGVA